MRNLTDIEETEPAEEQLAHWCSGLTRQPFKLKNTGSNPVCVAKR